MTLGPRPVLLAGTEGAKNVIKLAVRWVLSCSYITALHCRTGIVFCVSPLFHGTPMGSSLEHPRGTSMRFQWMFRGTLVGFP